MCPSCQFIQRVAIVIAFTAANRTLITINLRRSDHLALVNPRVWFNFLTIALRKEESNFKKKVLKKLLKVKKKSLH